MECLTSKINELKRNSRNKYIRKIYSCTHGFQKVKGHRTNFVMEEKADVFVDSHSRNQMSVKY
jgi:hypothetical protein